MEEAMDEALAGITFRSLREGDMVEIKALHEALFPVRYSQAFYDCAVRGYMCGTLQPLRSLVAVKDGRGMIGVVIAQVLPTGECGDAELIWPEHIYTEVAYILTLGTLPEYRRLGLGKLLLRKALDAIDSPRCGAVYLHVITYNEAAIQFYSANGFKRLRTLPAYYAIEEQRYDAHLMIHHLNRAMDPRAVTWLSGLLRPLVDLGRTVSASWAALKTKGEGRRPTAPAAAAPVSPALAAAEHGPGTAGGALEEKEQPIQPPQGLTSPLALTGRKWRAALPKQAPAPPPPPPVPLPRLGHEEAMRSGGGISEEEGVGVGDCAAENIV